MVKRPPTLGFNPARKLNYERERREAKPWRRWYSTERWRNLRLMQLRSNPLCRLCKEQGRDTEATVADHLVPHRGDPALFWHGTLQSLCDPCHSSVKQREERAAARSRCP
jgi:5-methylcytosine-specific restriction protein A